MTRNRSAPSPANPSLIEQAWSHDLERYLAYLEERREREGELRCGSDATLVSAGREGWDWMDGTFRQWMTACRTGLVGLEAAELASFCRTVLLRCWLGFHASSPPLQEAPRVLWINTTLSPIDFCASWVHGLARLQSPEAWACTFEAAQADALALAAAALRGVPLLPVHLPELRPVSLLEAGANAVSGAGINTLVVDGMTDVAQEGRSVLLGYGADEFHQALRYLARNFNLRILLLLLPTGRILPGHREAGGWVKDGHLDLTQVMTIRSVDEEKSGVRVELLADRHGPSGGTTLLWREALCRRQA